MFNKKFLSKNEFHSSLSGKGISGKEYEHILKVWNKLEMKKMEDYPDLYLKCGVLLVADVFEKFRNRCPVRMHFRIQVRMQCFV